MEEIGFGKVIGVARGGRGPDYAPHTTASPPPQFQLSTLLGGLSQKLVSNWSHPQKMNQITIPKLFKLK